MESQILGLCSFRYVVDFKGSSRANEESADLSGQTHWAQHEGDSHTNMVRCNLSDPRVNIYFSYSHSYCDIFTASVLRSKDGLNSDERRRCTRPLCI